MKTMIKRIKRRKLNVENLTKAIETYFSNAYVETRAPSLRTPREIAEGLLKKIVEENYGYTERERLGADHNGDAKIEIEPRRWLVFGRGFALGYNRNCFYYNDPNLIDNYQKNQIDIEEKVKGAWLKEGFRLKS